MPKKKDGPDTDYQCGYGKPPQASQWQTGESGNPAGRPRKPRELRGAVRKRLNEFVYPRMADGRVKKMTIREVLVENLIKQAQKGKRWASLLIAEMDSAGAGADDAAERASAAARFIKNEEHLVTIRRSWRQRKARLKELEEARRAVQDEESDPPADD